MLPHKSDSVFSCGIVVLHCAVGNVGIENLIMERQQRGLCVCVCTALILWRIDVNESNETCIGLHIKGPKFLFENGLTRVFLTGFNKIVQNKISQNLSIRSWYAWTDGQTEGKTERPDEANRSLPRSKEPPLKIDYLLKHIIVYALSQNCRIRLLAPPCLSIRVSARSME
jgi:hypothetical protein